MSIENVWCDDYGNLANEDSNMADNRAEVDKFVVKGWNQCLYVLESKPLCGNRF